jgi:hypothetical protein
MKKIKGFFEGLNEKIMSSVNTILIMVIGGFVIATYNKVSDTNLKQIELSAKQEAFEKYMNDRFDIFKTDLANVKSEIYKYKN